MTPVVRPPAVDFPYSDKHQEHLMPAGVDLCEGRLPGNSLFRLLRPARTLLREWVVGRLHMFEVLQERPGPCRGIVFLYPRQQRTMTLAALRKSHF